MTDQTPTTEAPDADALAAALADFDAAVAQARRDIMRENEKLDKAMVDAMLAKLHGGATPGTGNATPNA